MYIISILTIINSYQPLIGRCHGMTIPFKAFYTTARYLHGELKQRKGTLQGGIPELSASLPWKTWAPNGAGIC